MTRAVVSYLLGCPAFLLLLLILSVQGLNALNTVVTWDIRAWRLYQPVMLEIVIRRSSVKKARPQKTCRQGVKCDTLGIGSFCLLNLLCSCTI